MPYRTSAEPLPVLDDYYGGMPIHEIMKKHKIWAKTLQEIVGEEIEKPLCVNYHTCGNEARTFSALDCSTCYNRLQRLKAKHARAS